jgi:hypothetical protein
MLFVHRWIVGRNQVLFFRYPVGLSLDHTGQNMCSAILPNRVGPAFVRWRHRAVFEAVALSDPENVKDVPGSLCEDVAAAHVIPWRNKIANSVGMAARKADQFKLAVNGPVLRGIYRPVPIVR